MPQTFAVLVLTCCVNCMHVSHPLALVGTCSAAYPAAAVLVGGGEVSTVRPYGRHVTTAQQHSIITSSSNASAAHTYSLLRSMLE
jgi:hypothetical protein